MAVPSNLSFLRQGTGSQVLEIYLDPQCPFSKKITLAIDKHILPLIRKGGKYDGKLSIITWIYPQAFHYMSTIQSEAILAVGTAYPAAFWPFVLKVYDTQMELYNVPSQSMTINDVRDKLIHQAVEVLAAGNHIQGAQSQVFGKLRDMIQVQAGSDGSTNGNTQVTNQMKHIIKVGRQNGIHVTPTALFDGLIDNSVSSSWAEGEWEKFFTQKFSQ